MKPRRLSGGLIDKTKEIHFSFNSRPFVGYKGDTLASALFANGVILITTKSGSQGKPTL